MFGIDQLHPVFVHFPVAFLTLAAGAALWWFLSGMPLARQMTTLLLAAGCLGAFAAYYSNVSQWLGGGGGPVCVDADGDGYCANIAPIDCNDNNAKIYPGANDTRGKQGRDGIDNDCDGVPDK